MGFIKKVGFFTDLPARNEEKMRKIFQSLALVMLLVTAPWSYGFTNPRPDLLLDDNGLETFAHPTTMTVQLLFNPTGAEFGFYFDGFPGTRTAIFDSGDPAAVNPDVAAFSVIDFSLGQVRDFKTGTVRNTFAPASGDIDFYWKVSVVTLRSKASDNFGFLGDAVGVFPTIADPAAYVVTFYNPTSGAIVGALGVGLPTPVPEPETYVMLIAGLGLLGFVARRRKQKTTA